MKELPPDFDLEVVGTFTDEHYAILAELLIALDEAEPDAAKESAAE